MPIKVNDFRALLLAAYGPERLHHSERGEEAATIYRSAAAVCRDNKKSFKSFVDAGFALLGTSELRALSKAYPSTTGKWMKEGGETFNERVMSDGIFPACAYAITERRKAEEMAQARRHPTNQPPVTTQIPSRT